MSNKVAIVSLSDEKYFDLLFELISSIKSFKQSKDVSICILDAGMNKYQLDKLTPYVLEIKKAEWDIEVPNYKVRGREWLKSQVSRAFLPKYFKGFDKYIWIDSDAWINDWDAIELLIKGCNQDKLAITQTIAPGYRDVGRVNWIFKSLASVKTQNYKHAISSGFNQEIARKIAFAPHLNVGVFSLSSSSPGWNLWQEILKKSLSKGRVFGSEGLAINIAVYCNKLETEFLPPRCNWILSHLLPKYDESNNCFVEPFLPNQKIGIMHLAAGYKVGEKDIRDHKDVLVELNTIDGKKIKKSLRFQIDKV